MKISRESMIHNQSPEYRQALQELIKFELQALVERLSATGEEALVLTASCQDGTSMQFGSQKAESFLRKQVSLGQDFLSFCNDDATQSSGDEMCNSGEEMCNSGDDIEDPDQKDEENNPQKQISSPRQFSPNRPRERTSSKRISFTEEHPQDPYTGSQNSYLSASERNDSASSVASFADVQDNSNSSISKNNLQCRVCSRNFRSYKSLNVHMRLHMAKSYKCAICGKIFTLKKSYQRHIAAHRRQNKGKLFDCGICDKSYADLNAWKRHREIHLEVRNYSCNLCGKAFVEKYSLRVHQTSHFYPTAKIDKSAEPTSGFPCHVCGKVSKTKTAIKKHMLMHSAKKFTCEFCNKRFSVKYSYVRHRRIHTGERPYKCGFCERSFSDNSAWAKHIRTHTGGKQYSCDMCSKSFYDKTTCKTHMERHKLKNVKVGSGQNTEKRNFDIIAAQNDTDFQQESGEEKVDFNLRSSTGVYTEDLNLRLDVSDKESEDSRMLDSGFGSSLVREREEMLLEGREKSPDKKITSIIESFGLDEKFQTEFVERNMPARPLESDNELISTAFPDDSDILGDETETESQNAKFSLASPQKKKSASAGGCVESEPGLLERKLTSRRQHAGKIIPESPAKCKKCNKKFKQESVLKQHLQFHCMMKLYKCRYCAKQLTTKQSLIRHERIHMGDRPYQCYICQKTFADNYGCIRHMNNTHFNKEIKPMSTRRTRSKSRNAKESKSTLMEIPKKEIKQSDRSPVRNVSLKAPTYTTPYTTVTSVTAVQKSEESAVDIPKVQNWTVENEPVFDLSKSASEKMKVEKKHFYKCFRCPALFQSQQLCAEHIQKVCSKKSQDEIIAQKSNQSTTEKLSNIYQCMICFKMFSDKDYCEKHIADECQIEKADVDSAVKSILEEPELNLGVQGIETLPKLPFPEITSEPEFLSSDDNFLLPASTVSQSGSSLVQSGTVLNQSVSTSSRLTGSILSLSRNPITQSSLNIACTGSVLSQSSLTATQTTSSLGLLSGDKCLQSDSVKLTFCVSQPSSSIGMSRSTDSSSSSSSALQTQNTLLLIPFGQISGQNTSTIRLPVKTPHQTAGNVDLTSLKQKPVVNIGTSQYVVTSHNIGLVGKPGLGVVNSGLSNKPGIGVGNSRTGPTVVTKSGKATKTKGSQDDINERTCSICAKVFTTKHIVKQHMLIHAERNFGCKYCMKKFHNKYGRDRHERIHTGERPFSCPNCKKLFGDNSTYRKHTWKCCSSEK